MSELEAQFGRIQATLESAGQREAEMEQQLSTLTGVPVTHQAVLAKRHLHETTEAQF